MTLMLLPLYYTMTLMLFYHYVVTLDVFTTSPHRSAGGPATNVQHLLAARAPEDDQIQDPWVQRTSKGC